MSKHMKEMINVTMVKIIQENWLRKDVLCCGLPKEASTIKVEPKITVEERNTWKHFSAI